MMRRRAVLEKIGTTLAAGATAGCVLGERGGNGLRLEPVERFAGHAATQPREFSEPQAALVDAALDAGEHVTYGFRPFPDGTYVEVDGTFYRVEVAETGAKRMTRTVLRAEEAGGRRDDAVPIEAYPAADREPVIVACRLALARQRRSPDRATDDARYVVVFRTRTAESSALLPEPGHPVVTFDERPFRLRTERRQLEEAEFRSTLVRVADEPEAFRRAVAAEFVIDLDAHDLPPEQRAIVETAAEEGEYTESGRISPAFNELVTLLQEEAPRRSSLIKYEGEYYTWDYWHSD